jgi:NRAMP (natural resistance-associated macrophage protein)-like metal ion transporter
MNPRDRGPNRTRTIDKRSSRAEWRRSASWSAKVARVFAKVGPGIVTGAADDDPSGITTYSQAGAQFGFAMLWALLFSFPLIAGVQEISAWIGRVTGMGIARNIRRHYSPWVLHPIVALMLTANVINLGADIGAMGIALKLLNRRPRAFVLSRFWASHWISVRLIQSTRFFSAVITGIAAVPIMFLMMLMTANPKLMGTLRLPLPQRIVGWAATAVMFAVAVGMIATWDG